MAGFTDNLCEPNLHQLQESELEQPRDTLFLEALYCSDEHLEEDVEGPQCFSREATCFCFNDELGQNPFSDFLLPGVLSEDDELSSLFSKEMREHLYNGTEIDSGLYTTRSEAVDWMLKVCTQCSFSALTAVLAVNYFDRFMFTFDFQREKPWMSQLASLACLSLAAKVEEVQVPLLLDLQVEESRYVFEAKTIQRAEILVLSTLGWKMHPVTPLSFIDYMTERLGLMDHLRLEFIRRFERSLLSVLSDSRFVHHLPSAMAAAAMLHVVSSVAPSIALAHQTQLLGILKSEKGKVDECRKLLMELSPVGCGSTFHKRKLSSVPGSPKGVNDVSFSSDSWNESWSSSSSVSSSPQPPCKKNKAECDQVD